MNHRALILFVVGFTFISLFSVHLGSVYFPTSRPVTYPDTNMTPSSTLLAYANLFNSQDTETITSLITRSKRRVNETVPIEDVFADHFVRNIRIDKIRMGSLPVFSPDGTTAYIPCGIRWQMSDGAFVDEERNVTLVQEDSTWRLHGIIIPPGNYSI
jgi:hypothetical protein